MYECSVCHRPIGRFDAKNPPVCRTGGGKRAAKPTVLVMEAEDPTENRGAPSAASPSFVGD